MTLDDPKHKVSVIIAVYNSAKYLEQCIDSILAQTLTDFELICVNDGSTDNSGAILDAYAEKDSRVRVIHQSNTGAGLARNRGISEATGEYLSLLDSDDFFHPDMLKKAYDHAKEHQADICVFRTEHYNQETGEKRSSPWTLKADKLPGFQPFSWQDIKPFVFQFCIGWAWDKLFKTSFVREHGLSFPALRNSEDGVFVYRALASANTIVYLDDILVTQREYSNSLSKTRSSAPCAFYDSLLLLKDYLLRENIFNDLEQSFVNWSIEFSLWNYDTINSDSQETIIQLLNNKGWDTLGVTDKPSSYFYQQEHYIKYLQYRYGIIQEVSTMPPPTQERGNALRYRLLATITWGKRKQHYLKKLGRQ